MTDYFSNRELACPCCGNNEIDGHFLHWLECLRDVVNHPMEITSGYRCHSHNNDIGGATNSPHCDGLAVDVHCVDGVFRRRLVDEAIAAGASGIGIYAKHVHLDMAERDAPVIWHGTYSP